MMFLLLLSSCLLLNCVTILQQTSHQQQELLKLVKPNRAVVGSQQPTSIETTDSFVQCLMKLVTLYTYFIEIQKMTNNKYMCKMFTGDYREVATVSDTNSNIYGPAQEPQLCQDHQQSTSPPHSPAKSGVYKSYLVKTQVYCDMDQEGGGWTTIQRRVDGSVDFQRDWVDYKKGFGNPAGEYWLGLDKIHTLTNAFANVMLRIEASTFGGERTFMIFEGFKVGDEASLYKLTCGNVLEDSLSLADDWLYVDGRQFSTRDKDNDSRDDSNCSILKGGGGGWFKSCFKINFNGKYPKQGEFGPDFLVWKPWKSQMGLKSLSLAVKVKN